MSVITPEAMLAFATPIALIAWAVVQQVQAMHARAQSKEIHTLVNSNYGTGLRVAAVALRRVAELTKDPKDIAAAVEAEKALADHDAKQAMVDSSKQKGP